MMPGVDGLAVGTDVRLSGIKIGSVSALALDPKTYQATVHLSIKSDVKIPEDSSIMVTSTGLLAHLHWSVPPAKFGVAAFRPWSTCG